MTRVQISAALTVALCVVATGRTSAHHSIQAQFDVHKTVTVSGTVAKVEWINPHSYLILNVKDADGRVQKWAFEMTSVGQLRGAGLSRADRGGVKTGDEITVTALAARNGSTTGLAQQVKTADGRVFKLLADVSP